MKYKLLLKSLQLLIHLKRFFWWLGAKTKFVLAIVFAPLFRFFGYTIYKLSLIVKRISRLARINRKFFKRDYLQVFVLLILFFAVIPQTKLYSKANNVVPGQKSIAYTLVSSGEDFEIEEVVAEERTAANVALPSWKQGALSSEDNINTELLDHERELPAGVVAGGNAVSKPVIFPDAIKGRRGNAIEEYIIQPGDTVSGIAYRYGVSVATILWENNLNLNSYLQLGGKLRILPVSGLTYDVKSGDTVVGIAKAHGVKPGDIVKFNKLKDEGGSLQVGDKLIVPNGVKHYQSTAIAQGPGYLASSYGSSYAISSNERPSVSGFIWPAAMRTITQYYSWWHQAVDISGPVGVARGSATYAVKSGVVEVSQCGWNSGYGCYIIIDHGGGMKTLYGHHDKLLVSVGDYVKTGQTIGLMGNTGRVYGYDGVHVHFEIRINGVRVNPLGYVR